MGSPIVPEILKRVAEIHSRKSDDYAQDNDPFSNFKRSAEIASWFNDPVDKVFATIMGIKLSRLAELLNGKEPKNESIDDSFLDSDTYMILWHARYLAKQEIAWGTIPLELRNKQVSKSELTHQPKPGQST